MQATAPIVQKNGHGLKVMWVWSKICASYSPDSTKKWAWFESYVGVVKNLCATRAALYSAHTTCTIFLRLCIDPYRPAIFFFHVFPGDRGRKKECLLVLALAICCHWLLLVNIRQVKGGPEGAQACPVIVPLLVTC